MSYNIPEDHHGPLPRNRRDSQAKTDSEVLTAIREAISKRWWSVMNLHALYDKPVSEVLEALDRTIALAEKEETA